MPLVYNLYHLQFLAHLGGTSFYSQLRYFYFVFCCMTCCWPPLIELARQPRSVTFDKLQNLKLPTPPPNNHLLNSSQVVALRYSVHKIFPLLDSTYNEICQGKRDICQGFVREFHLSDLADSLIYIIAKGRRMKVIVYPNAGPVFCMFAVMCHLRLR